MGLGGGKFNNFNKKINGVYTRFITQGPILDDSIQGVVAAGIISDWAPDDTLFTIEKDDFEADPVKVTGYQYSDPRNAFLREIFKHAIKLYTYRLNSGGKKAKAQGVGTAKYTGSVGNQVTVSVLKNVLDPTKYDVTTYLNGVENDKQTVPEIGADEIALTKGTEKPGTAVETADATFTFADNKITVQFSNVPEGYKPSVRIKGQVGIMAFIPGRLEDMELSGGNKHIITYSPGAPINGEMTVEAVLTKDKVTVLKSCTYTCQLNEDVEVGADGSKLEANDFVEFDTGLIKMNAGYVFTGGSSSDKATVESHSAFLDKIEGYRFNDLFYDGTDETVKQTYFEFTRRLRDERGIYFQTILQNFKDADYEGIVSLYNDVLNSEYVKTATPWLAGVMSSLDCSQEATNYDYDGELTINADLSQSQIERLSESGHFFFHETDIDRISTYEDVNTFRSFTEDKNEEASQNKVIRTVDYIHNELTRICNRMDIGKLTNNEKGRTVLWTRVDTILSELADIGAIRPYEPTDIVVEPIKDQKNSVKIDINITVEGIIRKIYITTNVIK